MAQGTKRHEKRKQSKPVKRVLTINGGSSSLRYAVFELRRRPVRLFAGKLERLSGGAVGAADSMMKKLQAEPGYAAPDAIGHRIVHGMQRSAPERINSRLLAQLRKIVPYAPEHLPREIELIRAMQRHFKRIPQVACFDTAFHRSMPRVATLLPIPRRHTSRGVQRYGFHGLSFTFLMQELGRLGDAAASRGRVILAHLGSGASIAAVRHGLCIDTSMGFTPTAGLVMGTRTGDLDPGLMSYLVLTKRMNAKALQAMVNHESGLLGVSGTSADVRDLLEREQRDARARDALDLFCYQAKKWIGSFAAALGGVDTLVFAGGVGENAAPLRQRICAGLEFLGVELDGAANSGAAPIISTKQSRVSVRIIRTDEEFVIAQQTARLLEMSDTGE
ncbi:MAG: propionate kinase [Gammaproteobacteria bacterium]|jgi:acetate kinase|nr:propionate kinase [Gammaproteobacteria bacterium]